MHRAVSGGVGDWMSLGIHLGQAFPETGLGEGPVVEAVRAVASDDFFTAVAVPPVADESARRDVAAMLTSAGMFVACTVGGTQLARGENLGALDESERRTAVEAARERAELALELGARQLHLVSGPDPGEERRSAALDALATSLAEICACVRQSGLAVVLDIIDRTVQRRGLVGSTIDAVRVAREVRKRSDNFGLTVDLSHLPMLGESVTEAIGLAAPFLMNVHVGNCYLANPASVAYGDVHPRFGYPGSLIGTEEIAEFLAGLIDIGYLRAGGRNVVALNLRPLPGEDSALLVANGKRALRWAWSLVRAT